MEEITVPDSADVADDVLTEEGVHTRPHCTPAARVLNSGISAPTVWSPPYDGYVSCDKWLANSRELGMTEGKPDLLERRGEIWEVPRCCVV
jgi:hypothetical protein